MSIDARVLRAETTGTRTLTWQDPVPTAAAGARIAGLDYVRAIQSGELPPPPIAIVMNYSIAEFEEGRAVFQGEPGEEHYNPIGVVHGGYASTILDSALGCAVHTTLPAGVGYTSQTLEVKYLRPITRETGVVRCEAEVVHRGRRSATAEARLVAAETGKLLATGTSTCLILDS
ncbi:MAG TPA: PaaI family thioesterase [Solirubrobacterales bacterium]